MAKKRRRPSQGLGDTIEKITEATGIKSVVKFIFGEDCGCEERKEKLNKLFPYRKNNCLLEDEYNYLQKFFSDKWEAKQIRPTEQMALLKIYGRVFGLRVEPTNCATCMKTYLNEIKRVYDEYEVIE